MKERQTPRCWRLRNADAVCGKEKQKAFSKCQCNVVSLVSLSRGNVR